MGSYFQTLCIFSTFFAAFITRSFSTDEVPVALWNIQGTSLKVMSVSALGNDDNLFLDLIKEISSDNANILVYTVDKLSMEDFSSNEVASSSNNTLQNLEGFLDTQPYVFLPSVKEPLNKIHDIACGVQEIIVDRSIDDNVLKSVVQAFDRSCVVILHINNFGIAGINQPGLEDIKKVFHPTFDKTSKNLVGLFTSVKSSWVKSSEDHHMFRRLMEASVEADKTDFINITDKSGGSCLIAYLNFATVTVGGGANASNLTLPPDSSGSKCGNVSALLQLKFKGSGDISEATFEFNFTRSQGAWTTDVTIELSGKNVPTEIINLNSDTIGAAVGFSFSCGKLDLKASNQSFLVKASLERFQVEAFEVKGKFSESFDCVTWFTAPIWMGIFVSLIFVAIINCGVYALFSVHTMDRFDDPKGKTISVAAGTD